MMRERTMFRSSFPSWNLGPLQPLVRRLTSRDMMPAWLQQAMRYSTVGLLNTLLDAGLYLLFTRWLGLAGFKLLAKGLSYGISTLNSFHWNRSWTFQSTASALALLTPFMLASAVAIAINAAAMGFSLQLFHQQDIPSLAMATGITLLWNFTVSKFLIFRR